MADANEFETKRSLAAVNRGDMKTAEHLLGTDESRWLSWGITIALALFELKRSAQRRRCQAAIEKAYAGKRLLDDKEPGEDAATILCESIDTLIAARQSWRILRMAERIARKGGSDEQAVALLAGRVARAHSVALAADLRELDTDAAGPVSIVALSVEELRRDDEKPAASEPLRPEDDDEHAVETLREAADRTRDTGETCRIDVKQHARFRYRARAEGLAARRRTRSTSSPHEQAQRMRQTIDAGLRRLYRTARLRHADVSEQAATEPSDATAVEDGTAEVAIRHANLQSFIARTARAAKIEEKRVVAIAAEAEIAHAERVGKNKREYVDGSRRP